MFTDYYYIIVVIGSDRDKKYEPTYYAFKTKDKIDKYNQTIARLGFDASIESMGNHPDYNKISFETLEYKFKKLSSIEIDRLMFDMIKEIDKYGKEYLLKKYSKYLYNQQSFCYD